MNRELFSSKGFWEQGICLVRICLGIIMIVYGWQIFDKDAMSGYKSWLSDLGLPLPGLMSILGKLAELIGGISLILGLFTKWLMIPLVVTMTVIIFIMGRSDPFGEDQHPFLLLMLSVLFMLVGPGKISLDYILFDKRKNQTFKKPAYASSDPVSR